MKCYCFYKIIFVVGLATFLSSCDALLSMPYVVKNRTKETVRLKVSNYAKDFSGFNTVADTIINVLPNQSINISWAKGIGFPWGTKSLYKKDRGVSSFKLMLGDSLIPLDLNDNNWKYKSKASVYSIKNLPTNYISLNNKLKLMQSNWYINKDTCINAEEIKSIAFTSEKTNDNYCSWRFGADSTLTIVCANKYDGVYLKGGKWVVNNKALEIGTNRFFILSITERELLLIKSNKK